MTGGYDHAAFLPPLGCRGGRPLLLSHPLKTRRSTLHDLLTLFAAYFISLVYVTIYRVNLYVPPSRDAAPGRSGGRSPAVAEGGVPEPPGDSFITLSPASHP